ncbi:T9SS type A sorting domain-containing protein [Mariniphaga sp.]|uniref:T9SS type A sorting domain-containing protein n=1 Tax=Mariniphaga sp. TaxID=1954475 RepID=UPI0035694D0B
MKKLIFLFCVWILYTPVPGQNISQVEYFFNNDPGFGKAVSVPVTAGIKLELAVNIPLNDLDLGLNTLYVRAKSENGNWGQTYCSSFLVTRLPDSDDPKIAAVEYFFNNDPGFGKAVSVPVTAGIKQELAINISLNELNTGLNTLYVRAKSENGNWGQTYCSSFLVTRLPDLIHSKLISMEYFFDDDPGVGNGNSISFLYDYQTVVDVTLPLKTLSDGQHILYVRAKDEKGVWGGVFQQQFLVLSGQNDMPVITKAEYFVNTDPGFGKGIPVPINTPRTTVRKFFTVAAEHLTPGNDTVYIRVQDNRGNWSPTFSEIIQTLEAAAGSPPDNLEVSGITENSVNLTWNTGAATGWDMVWGPSGFDYTEEGILVLHAGNNSHKLEELTGGTSYEFYIRSSFPTGLVSYWGGPYSFTTSGLTDVAEISSGEISIFPNPASNRLYVRLSNQNGQKTILRLYNLQGQLLRDKNYNSIENSMLQMDLKGLVPGIYFLNLENKQLNLTRKVIIQ